MHHPRRIVFGLIDNGLFQLNRIAGATQHGEQLLESGRRAIFSRLPQKHTDMLWQPYAENVAAGIEQALDFHDLLLVRRVSDENDCLLLITTHRHPKITSQILSANVGDQGVRQCDPPFEGHIGHTIMKLKRAPNRIRIKTVRLHQDASHEQRVCLGAAARLGKVFLRN